MESDQRTPLVMVAGWGAPGREGADVARAARALLAPGTFLVRHDLRAVSEGVVRRTVTTVDSQRLSVLELAHGCVSCTLREDLLPLLRRLHARADVHRIVLQLDPALEPEALCWAITHVVVGGLPGTPDATAAHDVRIEAVVTTLDASTWLVDATGEDDLADRGWGASADDERTVAQLTVGQVELADVVVVCGEAETAWDQARLDAVLDRLAPRAVRGDATRVSELVAAVRDDARRGRVDDAHAPLLQGQPPLEADAGVQLVELSARRPFHPVRLHDAVDVLLDGVVRTRARVWLATQPDVALWLESAGGGLQVGTAGAWLATLAPDDQAWAGVNPQRRALASLRWDPEHGDRDVELVALAHAADPEDIITALRGALLTDDEMALGQNVWSSWEDPFADYHTDPCTDSETGASPENTPTTRGHQS